MPDNIPHDHVPPLSPTPPFDPPLSLNERVEWQERYVCRRTTVRLIVATLAAFALLNLGALFGYSVASSAASEAHSPAQPTPPLPYCIGAP